VHYLSYETAKLGEITDEYYFAAQCSVCKHRRRFKISTLRDALGTNFEVRRIRPRLRCNRCGSKQIIVSFFNPGHRAGSLHRLFDTPAE
jgi:hypothetical protein